MTLSIYPDFITGTQLIERSDNLLTGTPMLELPPNY